MEADATLPHAHVPLSHATNDAVPQVAHEHVAEDRAHSGEDAGHLDGIVDIGYDPNGCVSQRHRNGYGDGNNRNRCGWWDRGGVARLSWLVGLVGSLRSGR